MEPPKGFPLYSECFRVIIIRKQLIPNNYEYDNKIYIPLEEITPEMFGNDLALFNWALSLPNKNNISNSERIQESHNVVDA